MEDVPFGFCLVRNTHNFTLFLVDKLFTTLLPGPAVPARGRPGDEGPRRGVPRREVGGRGHGVVLPRADARRGQDRLAIHHRGSVVCHVQLRIPHLR